MAKTQRTPPGRLHKRFGRSACLGASTLLLLLLLAPPAEAHASLVSADPAPNTRVETAPAVLVLHFSERLETQYTRVELIDSQGRDHVQELEFDPERHTRLVVHLEPLGDGIHTVRWRTLSADDGHTTQGAYLLAVRVDFPDDAPPPTEERVTDGVRPWETLLRTLAYLGSALALGGTVFLVWDPGRLPGRVQQRLQWGVLSGAGIAALAAFSLVATLAARIDTTAWEAARSIAFGQWNALRGLLLAAAALGAAVALWSRSPAWQLNGLLAAAAGTVAAGLCAAMASHAAAMPANTALAITVHWLHFLAAALWIGMVLGVLAFLWDHPHPPDAARLVRRFSPVALALVAILVTTGVYNTNLHIDDLRDARGTAYGAALATKVLLLGAILAVAALHRYVFTPRLERGGDPKAIGRVRASVLLETLLMVGVLVAAGALTHAAPPHDHTGHDHHDHHGLPGQAHTFGGDGHLLTVTVLPQPVRVGIQNLTVHLEPGPDGVPENANLFLQVTDPQDETGPIRSMDRLDETRWSLRDAHFTEGGTWQVRVLFQGRATSIDTTFPLDVRP